MYAYDESELLRRARVRTEFNLPDGRIDIAELNRAVAQARAETLLRLIHGVGRAFGSAVAWLGAWRRYRVAVSELEGLDPRTLTDIGITRADIPRVAAGLWMPNPTEMRPAAESAIPASNENARKAAA
jgi:uncharacterized protein YjiS (DUF1127 family)